MMQQRIIHTAKLFIAKQFRRKASHNDSFFHTWQTITKPAVVNLSEIEILICTLTEIATRFVQLVWKFIRMTMQILLM